MGTFGGALEARQINASDGKLTADVTGEVESEEGVLVYSQDSRRDATSSAGRSQRENSTRARALSNALSSVSAFLQTFCQNVARTIRLDALRSTPDRSNPISQFL
jgi:hypothetical protein